MLQNYLRDVQLLMRQAYDSIKEKGIQNQLSKPLVAHNTISLAALFLSQNHVKSLNAVRSSDGAGNMDKMKMFTPVEME